MKANYLHHQWTGSLSMKESPAQTDAVINIDIKNPFITQDTWPRVASHSAVRSETEAVQIENRPDYWLTATSAARPSRSRRRRTLLLSFLSSSCLLYTVGASEELYAPFILKRVSKWGATGPISPEGVNLSRSSVNY